MPSSAANGLRYWRWVGVDSAWEKEKTEARKMIENAADSAASSARFVGRLNSKLPPGFFGPVLHEWRIPHLNA
jgi:hypothetical protein